MHNHLNRAKLAADTATGVPVIVESTERTMPRRYMKLNMNQPNPTVVTGDHLICDCCCA